MTHRKSGKRILYEGVNNKWPDNMPPFEPQEALSAFRRLYRYAFGKTFTAKVRLATSKNDYTHPTDYAGRYPGNGQAYYNWSVNPARGWQHLVHILSHYSHAFKRPRAPNHGIGHAFEERDLIAYVLKKGWLDGRLRGKPKAPKPVAPKPSLQEKRAARVQASIVRAEQAVKDLTAALKAKQKHLKKLNAKRKYYAVVTAKPGAPVTQEVAQHAQSV